MINEFLEIWNNNKNNLEEYFRNTEQEKYSSYYSIVKVLFEQVINNGYKEKFNLDDIIEIDNGSYQGTLIYILHLDTYQPSEYEYIVTCVDYGSCSYCDTLYNISNYESEKPSEEQIKDYMTLSLHLLQKCKWLYKEDDKQ